MTSTSKMQHQQNGESRTRGWRHAWPLERILFAMAGTVTLLSAALAATVSPWFLVGTGFMGAGLLFAGATGICALATMLSKMPWNRPTAATGPTPGANACSSAGSRSCCG